MTDSQTPIYEIPPNIIEAAGLVASYMNDRGYREFTICGLSSANKVGNLQDKLLAALADQKSALEKISTLERDLAEVIASYDSAVEALQSASNQAATMRLALVRLLRAFESDYEQMPDSDVRTSWETNSQAIAQARATLARAGGVK